MPHSPTKTVCSCRLLPFFIPARKHSGANPPQFRMNPGFFITFRTLPQQHLFNEYYARDISKKRKIVNKLKGNSGVPPSPPPYGYLKNPEDPRFWVIDPEAAAVVRRIYQMALDGYGLAKTAAALEKDGICNPTYYWQSKGTNRGGSKSTVDPTKWGHTTIKKILTPQEYCGDVIISNPTPSPTK